MSDTVTPTASGSNLASVGSVTSTSLGSGNNSRLYPRQISTGSTRGTQTVGYGSVKIDGTSNSIILSDPLTNNTTLTISATGYQLFTNPKTNVNQIIIGLLPDSTFGMVVSKPGVDVLSVFNAS